MSVTNVSKYIHNLFLITTVETNLNKAIWILTLLCNKAVFFPCCPVNCQIRNKSFTKITGTDDTFQESNNYFNYNNKIIILLTCIMPICIQIFKIFNLNYQVYTYSFVHIVFWANQYFHWETSEPNTSVQDSRKLPSYPSQKPTFTPTSNLRQIVGLGVGYMGSFQSLALTNLLKTNLRLFRLWPIKE